jgi:hypothetical protein
VCGETGDSSGARRRGSRKREKQNPLEAVSDASSSAVKFRVLSMEPWLAVATVTCKAASDDENECA